MKTSDALLSLWYSPRATINKLTDEHSIKKDLTLVLGLSLSLFLQVGLFIYLIDVIPAFEFVNRKAFEAYFWIVIALAGGIYSYANFAAWVIFNFSKRLMGKGSLANTRTAVLWSMVAYIPLGFSIHWILLSNNTGLENLTFLNFLPILSLPIIFLYSFTLTLKMISEIHQFRLIDAFISVLLCIIVQIGFVVAIFVLFG